MKTMSYSETKLAARAVMFSLLCTVSFHVHADTDTPITTITSDLNNLVEGSITFSGTTDDRGGSGVDRVWLSVRNSEGLFYYDGAFRPEDRTTFRHLNLARGTSRWTLTVPLQSGTYEVTARARDEARNQDPGVRDRRTIIVQARSTVASNSSSSFVQGNTLVFPDNGYYQVQTADGSRNICEGERSCDVQNGTYLIINHSSGDRFENIVVGSNGTASASQSASGSGNGGITVSGNTIRFPNNDYYQIQTADGSRNICEGARSCDVQDGTYVVINHTTRERFNGIVVRGSTSSSTPSTPQTSVQSVITVNGNTISWPDNGYYQLQTIDGSRSICEGERSCTVAEAGEYLVINHTTGERLSAVVQGQGGTQSASLRIEDAPLLVRAATLSDFLTDESVLLRLSELSLSDISGVPNPFTLAQIAPEPNTTILRSDGTELAVSRFRDCDEGGRLYESLFFLPSPGPTVDANSANDHYYSGCRVNGLELQGSVLSVSGDFEELDEFNVVGARDINVVYEFQAFEVREGDRVVSFDSSTLVNRGEVFDGVEFNANTADFLVAGQFPNYTVSDSTGSFTLRDAEISLSRFSGENTAISSFIVESLNGRTVNAQGAISEVFSISPNGEFLESGVLQITAGNSSLRIEANDQSTYLVTQEVDGNTMSAILPWSGTELSVPGLAAL